MDELLIGAVAYHPRVVTIWESFRKYFTERGLPVDHVLYSNYGRLVDAVEAGDVDIGWNTNAAFVALDHRVAGQTQILGMRDVDARFASVLLARNGEFGEDVPDELNGRRLALGNRDSAHAAILPLHFLRLAGLEFREVDLLRFDSDLGKHGDSGSSERSVVRAVAAGEADVGAIGDPTLAAFRAQAVPELEGLEVVWRSPTYYHCNFTALTDLDSELRDRWVDTLLAMRFEDPEMRPAMELEGVRRWLPGDRDGYASLFDAMREEGLLG